MEALNPGGYPHLQNGSARQRPTTTTASTRPAPPPGPVVVFNDSRNTLSMETLTLNDRGGDSEGARYFSRPWHSFMMMTSTTTPPDSSHNLVKDPPHQFHLPYGPSAKPFPDDDDDAPTRSRRRRLAYPPYQPQVPGELVGTHSHPPLPTTCGSGSLGPSAGLPPCGPGTAVWIHQYFPNFQNARSVNLNQGGAVLFVPSANDRWNVQLLWPNNGADQPGATFQATYDELEESGASDSTDMLRVEELSPEDPNPIIAEMAGISTDCVVPPPLPHHNAIVAAGGGGGKPVPDKSRPPKPVARPRREEETSTGGSTSLKRSSSSGDDSIQIQSKTTDTSATAATTTSNSNSTPDHNSAGTSAGEGGGGGRGGDKVPPQRSRRSGSSTHFCKLCKTNKEPSSFYRSHNLYAKDGVTIVCPVLRSLVCPTCHATGDKAHTAKYCPMMMQVVVKQPKRKNQKAQVQFGLTSTGGYSVTRF